MDAGLDEIAIELVRHACGALMKAFEILSAPPVAQPPLRIKLRTLIVKAVTDLMADDHSDAAVIHGVHGLRIKGRWLQDACREEDRIQQGVVAGIGGRWRLVEAAAIGGLADAPAVVADVPRARGKQIAPVIVRNDVHPGIALPLV